MNPARMVPADLAVWAIMNDILAPGPSWPPFRQGVPGGRDHAQVGILHQYTEL